LSVESGHESVASLWLRATLRRTPCDNKSVDEHTMQSVKRQAVRTTFGKETGFINEISYLYCE
jgi:hypothetical protein